MHGLFIPNGLLLVPINYARIRRNRYLNSFMGNKLPNKLGIVLRSLPLYCIYWFIQHLNTPKLVLWTSATQAFTRACIRQSSLDFYQSKLVLRHSICPGVYLNCFGDSKWWLLSRPRSHLAASPLGRTALLRGIKFFPMDYCSFIHFSKKKIQIKMLIWDGLCLINKNYYIILTFGLG